MNEDNVNHPKHYNEHPSGIECIDVCQWFGFNVGNAIKYLWRAGLKERNDFNQDVEKAIWYLKRELGHEEVVSLKDSVFSEYLKKHFSAHYKIFKTNKHIPVQAAVFIRDNIWHIRQGMKCVPVADALCYILETAEHHYDEVILLCKAIDALERLTKQTEAVEKFHRKMD